MRIKYLILLVFTLYSLRSLGHSAMVSTTELRQQDDKTWQISVKAALTAHEFAVTQHFGRGAYKDTSDFKKLLIQHALANLSVQLSDEKSADLIHGRVQLGHESIVTFDLNSLPEELNSLIIRNEMFRQLKGNQNTLTVLFNDSSKQRFMLYEAKGFKQEVTFQEKAAKATESEAENNQKTLVIVLSVLVLIPLGLILYKKYKI